MGGHKILVSAPVPLELILTGFDWVGLGLGGLGFGTGLDNKFDEYPIHCIILRQWQFFIYFLDLISSYYSRPKHTGMLIYICNLYAMLIVVPISYSQQSFDGLLKEIIVFWMLLKPRAR